MKKMRSVNIGVLLPHEIMAALYNYNSGTWFFALIGLPNDACPI